MTEKSFEEALEEAKKEHVAEFQAKLDDPKFSLLRAGYKNKIAHYSELFEATARWAREWTLKEVDETLRDRVILKRTIAARDAEISRLKANLDVAVTALDKIRDPRKRHSEPDKYTEVGCLMQIADTALAQIAAEPRTTESEGAGGKGE